MEITKILSEKLKYLLGLDSGREFEILDLDLDFYGSDSGYALHITFDYLGPIDSQTPHFFGDVSEMMNKMVENVSKATVTPDKKISLSQPVEVECFIDKIEYKSEEKHIFSVSCLVHYIDKD